LSAGVANLAIAPESRVVYEYTPVLLVMVTSCTKGTVIAFADNGVTVSIFTIGNDPVVFTVILAMLFSLCDFI
jgi:hypothetical protein